MSLIFLICAVVAAFRRRWGWMVFFLVLMVVFFD